VLPPLHEGSVQPVDEFALILESYRQVDEGEKAHARAVVRQSLMTLQRIIELLVTTGGTNAHFRKGVSCLKVQEIPFYLFLYFVFRRCEMVQLKSAST
jgi:hypothetical protein